MSEPYEELAEILSGHYHKKHEAARIVRDVETGAITKEEALAQLRALENAASSSIAEFVKDDLSRILTAVDAELSNARKHASRQYWWGIFLLPACIAVSLAYAWFATAQGQDNAAAAAVIASCLGAAVLHVFYVLRVYQQGSTAAERLTEKKVGLLFLQQASVKSGAGSEAYLQAGLTMFLNHHAPTTLPLSPQEKPRIDGASALPTPQPPNA